MNEQNINSKRSGKSWWRIHNPLAIKFNLAWFDFDYKYSAQNFYRNHARNRSRSVIKCTSM